MDSKEAIRRIKVALGMEEPTPEVIETPIEEVKPEVIEEVIEEVKPEETELEEVIELKQGKLLDGTPISYDKLEIGGVVNVMTDPNTPVLIPEGEYVIDDNTKIKCDGTGTIVEIEIPEVEVPDEAPVAVQESRLEELEKKYDSLVEILDKMSSKFEKQVKELGKTPSAEPVHFSKEVSDEPLTLLEERLKTIKKLK